MKEKITSFNSELNNITLVVDKLVTKQNSSVFDKICKMCSDLFDKVCAIDPKSLSKEDLGELIGVLKRLLEICQKLKNYKEYLIEVVSNNIQNLNEIKDSKVNESPVSESPQEVINNVEEVQPEELETGVILQLNPEKEKNAA